MGGFQKVHKEPLWTTCEFMLTGGSDRTLKKGLLQRDGHIIRGLEPTDPLLPLGREEGLQRVQAGGNDLISWLATHCSCGEGAVPRFHGARVWELRGALPTQTSALCVSRSAALEFYN